MEKNQKNQTHDLLERAVTLAELAGKCHRLGLITDFHVRVEVENDNAYAVKVVADKYRTTEKIWCEAADGYLMEARVKEKAIDFESMAGYLQGLLDERKAQLLAELKIMEG